MSIKMMTNDSDDDGVRVIIKLLREFCLWEIYNDDDADNDNDDDKRCCLLIQVESCM